MNDSIGAEPVTLDSCEKYHIFENIWTDAADLNIQRSYAGVATFQHFAYVFGGLRNFMALDTIEKYDSLLDIWTILDVKLPFNVAKMGVAPLNDSGRNVLICGGLFSDENGEFSYISTTYQ